jgi:hypothetical protein
MQTRRVVERAVAMGLDQMQIGTLLGLSDRSLRKHYRNELDTGFLKLVSKIGDKLIDKIEAGDKASIFFFLKTRCGWSENGSAVNVQVAQQQNHRVVLRVPGMMDPEEWNKVAAEHHRLIP